MSNPKSPSGKLPSKRIEVITDELWRGSGRYGNPSEYYSFAIIKYLDEQYKQSNLKHEEGK